jgi:sugar/nucleoside kinase (ribokinase family)
MIGHSIGGNGANTSYALARLGVPVRLLAAIGDDREGDEMMAGLRSTGVDTRGVTGVRGATATTIALVRSDGNRLFLHKPGVNLDALPEPIDFIPWLIQGVSYYHLANPFALPAFRPHAAETLRRAHAAGLRTSLDAAWDSLGLWLQDLGPCLPHVDILFVNEQESQMLTGLDDPLEGAKALQAAGARTVVVKLGGRGCSVLSRGEQFQVPAFAVETLDTTGAGDCFAGGFLAAIQRGYTEVEAARIANAVGALSVRRVGAVAGLLSWEETEEWMSTANVRSQS